MENTSAFIPALVDMGELFIIIIFTIVVPKYFLLTNFLELSTNTKTQLTLQCGTSFGIVL